MWNVSCFYKVNGVQCSVTKELFVANLKDPDEIIKYFENAEFWEVPIFRGQVTSVACRNCGCEDELESISFISGYGLVKLTNQFENFANFRPLQGMDYKKNITNNSCLCNEDGTTNIPQLESSLGEGELSVWGHQFFKDPNTLGGTLYLKASMPWESASPSGTHRIRMNLIKKPIVDLNSTTTLQAKSYFTNLFMTHPIGGYDITQVCDLTSQFDPNDFYVSPAGVPIKVPQGSTNLVFAKANNSDNVSEGSLVKFNSGVTYHAYKQDNIFAGYYYDVVPTLKQDFIVANNLPLVKFNMPITCDGNCYLSQPEKDLTQSGSFNQDGGISEEFSSDFTGEYDLTKLKLSLSDNNLIPLNSSSILWVEGKDFPIINIKVEKDIDNYVQCAKFRIMLKVTYRIDGCLTCALPPDNIKTVLLPNIFAPYSIIEGEINETFDFGQLRMGGFVEVWITDDKKTQVIDKKTFTIKGNNPKLGDVLDYAGQQTNTWFWKKMIIHESSSFGNRQSKAF